MLEPDGQQVTTVVIAHNGGSDLVRTMARHQRPAILVDNGSTDGAPDRIAERHPDVRVVRLGANLGAPARNVGVQLANTPYVAFADDDSWWSAGALDRAADVLRSQPDVAVVAASVVINDDGKLDPLCAAMSTSPLPERPDVGGRAIGGFLCCAAVVRRDAFLSAGGFDDVVFFCGEEERLTLDLLAAGWELLYVPDVVAHHRPSPSRDRTRRHRLQTRNEILTAVMRRPWPVVLRRTGRALRHRAGRAGVRDALPRLGSAVARRQLGPAHVEQRFAQLDHFADQRASGEP